MDTSEEIELQNNSKNLWEAQNWQIFRLRELYLNDENVFYKLIDYLPFLVSIHNRENFQVFNINNTFATCFQLSRHEIITRGLNLIAERSDPSLMSFAFNKIKQFESNKDFNEVCYYLQRILVGEKPEWILSQKVILNDKYHLTIGYFLHQLGPLGKSIIQQLPADGEELIYRIKLWESLTVTEKKLFYALFAGMTNEKVAEKWFISINTVRTHRNNLFKKLQVSRSSELSKYQLMNALI